MLLIITLYAIIALTFTISKVAVASADPLFLVAVRMIASGILLLAIRYFTCVYTAQTYYMRDITYRDIRDFFMVSFFHIYAAFVLEFWALQYVSSIKANFTYALTPFIAMLFSYLLYGSKITFKQLIGVCTACLGMIPLLVCSSDIFFSTDHCYSFTWADVSLLGAVISSTYAWFVIRTLVERGYVLVTINGIAMLLGGLGVALTWIFTRDPYVFPIYDMSTFFITVIALIILSNIVIYNLYGWLMTQYSINFLTFAGFLSPLFGSFLGILFLGERVSWYHGFALTTLIIGLYIFYRDER